MPELVPNFSTGVTQGIPQLRYPQDVGKEPFEKFIVFEARSGRHVVRDKIVTESSGGDRLLSSVALYLSESALRNSLAITYDRNDLGPFVGAIVELLAQKGQNLFNVSPGQLDTSFNGISGILKSIVGAVAAGSEEAVKSAVGALNNPNITTAFTEAVKADIFNGIASLAGSNGDVAGIIAGQKPNPRTDVLFNTTDYRTHQIDFMMIPRNVAEAQMIDKIINFFQFYSLPSYRSNQQTTGSVGVGAFMIGFPYEFEIRMLTGHTNGSTTELSHINKIGRSVLTSIAVDHAASGRTAFIKDNGEYYPVATRMQLTFQEVRLLGRDSTEIQRPGGVTPGDPEKDPRA